MTEAPVATTPIRHPTSADDAEADPLQWQAGLAAIAEGETYWLATTRPDGTAHAVPVLAVVHASAVHFAASARSRKARNLATNPRCVVGTSASGLDLVVEGRAAPVTDDPTLRRVAETYQAKYGWPPEVRGGALWAEGAPTAGPPPYQVWRVEPAIGFALPAGRSITPTRWRFPAAPAAPESDPVAVVRAMFDAYLAQDRSAAERLIGEEFTFTSPQDDHIDRDAFFERCFPTADRVVFQQLLEVVPAGGNGTGAGEGVFVRYEYELSTGERHRNTEFIRVRDGQIVETEVYFG